MRNLLFATCCVLSLPALAGGYAIVDTQAQFDPQPRVRADFSDSVFEQAVAAALAEMDRYGVAKTLIVPPPFSEDVAGKYDFEQILPAIADHRERFDFLAGGGSLSPMILSTPPDQVTEEIRQRFRQRCEQILAAGALGFGEVTAMHLSIAAAMGDKHRYSATAPDHPLLLLLADIAAEHDVPIDIHFDVFPYTMDTPPRLQSPRNPPVLEENLAAFERFLAHNRGARITWAHIGSDPGGNRNPRLMRRLLEQHPNLYMAFRVTKQRKGPVFPLNPRGQLKPKWRELIIDFSDRFTIHSDNFYVPAGATRRGPRQSHELAIKMLDQLPGGVARALAHENAKRIYRLGD